MFNRRVSRKYHQKGGNQAYIPHSSDESEEKRHLISDTNMAIAEINKELEKNKNTMMGKILKMTLNLDVRPSLRNIAHLDNEGIKNHVYHVAAYYLKKPLNELQCINDKFVISDSLIQDKYDNKCKSCDSIKTYITYDMNGDLKFICYDPSMKAKIWDTVSTAYQRFAPRMDDKDLYQKTEIYTTPDGNTKYGYYACNIDGPIKGHLQGFFLHSTDKNLVDEIDPGKKTISKCAGIFYTEDTLISGIFNLFEKDETTPNQLVNLNSIKLKNGMGHVLKINSQQINTDETYTGEWTINKSGVKYDGSGTLQTKLSTYTGSWVNGKKNGYGSRFDTREEYIGHWKDDKYHGSGTLQYFWHKGNNVKVASFNRYNTTHWDYDAKKYNDSYNKYTALKMLPIERIVGNWEESKLVGVAVINYFNSEHNGVENEYKIIYPPASTKSLLPDQYYFDIEIRTIIARLESDENAKKMELDRLQHEINIHVVPKKFIPKQLPGFWAGLFGVLAGAFTFVAVAVVTGPFAVVAAPLAAAAVAARVVDSGQDHYVDTPSDEDTVKLKLTSQKDATLEELRKINSTLNSLNNLVSKEHKRGGYRRKSLKRTNRKLSRRFSRRRPKEVRVPFMMTESMKIRLKGMGYTDADIHKMRTDIAHDILTLKSLGNHTNDEIHALSPEIVKSILKLNA